MIRKNLFTKKVWTLERFVERLQKDIIKDVTMYVKQNPFVNNIGNSTNLFYILSKAQIKAEKYIDEIILKQYILGSKGKKNKYNLTQSDKNIINISANMLKSRLNTSLKESRANINRLLAQTMRDVKNKEEVAQTFIDLLNKQKPIAFIDRAGKRWGLSSYMNMATRTQALQTYNAGALSEDWDLYQVSKTPTKCPICSKVLGKVYSKSGTSKKYPPITELFGKIDPNGSNSLDNSYLCIHPNCVHKLYKYKETGKEGKQDKPEFKREHIELINNSRLQQKREMEETDRERMARNTKNVFTKKEREYINQRNEKYENRLNATENYFKRMYGNEWKEKMRNSGYYVKED